MMHTTYMKKILLLLFICNCLKVTSQNTFIHNIIPQPKTIKVAGGKMRIDDISIISIPKQNKQCKRIAQLYVNALNLKKVKILESPKPVFGKSKSIVLQLNLKENNPDQYSLTSSKSGILIIASTEKGLFYALQTLLQLIEVENQLVDSKTMVPFINIEDDAAFKYRGLHLDVSRHFFSLQTIKLYLDLMSRYKYNTFHWHLTDDQGWRLEIKRFPELTATGAYRDETLIGHYSDQPHKFDGVKYGGFYTQEEVKEIVAYAADRFIEVIPEIEMPGHASAALASYPIFGCSGGPYKVEKVWGVFNSVFCTKDTTLWFMKEILEEVCDLFPSKYIHIGGDEVPKSSWSKCSNCKIIKQRQGLKNEEELQSYFIQQIDIYLTNKGKKLIGWDEILEGGLSPNATVMSWRGVKGGIQAAKENHDVIMCPGTHCYFDHYQSTHSKEPLAIGGYTSLEKVYNFNPIPTGLTEGKEKHILGAQGNLWTEYIPNENHLLYMTYPRAIALSEVNWSTNEGKNYQDFLLRLKAHAKWFRDNKLPFSLAYMDLKYKTKSNPNGVEFYFIKPNNKGSVLLERESPDEGIIQDNSSQDTFLLDKSIDFNAWYQDENKTLGRPLKLSYNHHLAAGKKISLIQQPSEKYFNGESGYLVNGFKAPQNKFSGDEWVGMEGKDFEAIIEFDSITEIQSIGFQFFSSLGSWIHFPTEILMYKSNDGKNFIDIHKEQIIPSNKKCIEPEILFKEKKATKFLKILVKNHGEIQEPQTGAGHKAWLFIGEITIL